VNLKYGNELALLSGDALISKSIKLSSKYGREVVNALSETAMMMCSGEAIDYRYQKSKAIPTIRSYMKIARLKTGSITGISCAAIAIHKKSSLAGSLYAYGSLLGIGFQIRDDIFDFIGLEKENLSLSKRNPNIITVIKKRYGISTQQAIKKAAKINQDYIDKAIGELKDSRLAKLLGPYATMVRTGFE
jgi:geranylgeranyl pyrophosphate synthase